jgi:hypothetical protein
MGERSPHYAPVVQRTLTEMLGVSIWGGDFYLQ